jgi:hypothetical protein
MEHRPRQFCESCIQMHLQKTFLLLMIQQALSVRVFAIEQQTLGDTKAGKQLS